MNIAISINGEGRGHISRAKALAEGLQKRHAITFFAPAHFRAELLREFPASDLVEIPYLCFAQRGFTLDYGTTVARNATVVLSALATQATLAREVSRREIGAVLSDFEPFVPRAAKAMGIPVLQLNHPGIVLRAGVSNASHLVSRAVANYMMGMSDKTVICSFFGGDVGPILRRELREAPARGGSHVVVYAKERYRDILRPVLERLGSENFRLFPDPGANYAESLASSAALVAPAGHQSISEAMALGKPAFVIPVRGQYEQELNARMLRKSGGGDWCYFNDVARRLPEFLDAIPRHERALSSLRADSGKPGDFWRCSDDTDTAIGIVERFLLEARRRTDWRRVRASLPLQAALAATPA